MIDEILQDGLTHSRRELSERTGFADRTVRQKIQEIRRRGVLVYSPPEGGYRIARTDAEREAVIRTMRRYGLSAMVTAARLRKNMQAEGQEVMEL